jgi:hypothetical protein
MYYINEILEKTKNLLHEEDIDYMLFLDKGFVIKGEFDIDSLLLGLKEIMFIHPECSGEFFGDDGETGFVGHNDKDYVFWKNHTIWIRNL